MTPAPEQVLVAAIIDAAGATAVRYGIRDDQGTSMDTLKVAEDAHGGYFGVYHSRTRGGRFRVHLATSTDLLTWHRRAVLDPDASQPMLTAVPSGGFLLAVEAAGAGRPSWVRLRHFRDAASLLAARPDRTFDAPHTLVPPDESSEGTPHIEAASPDLATIDVGFHYFRGGVVDRQARGRLTGFRQGRPAELRPADRPSRRSWATATDPAADAAIEAWDVRGNIGGRDNAEWNGARVTLIEGQLRRGDWGSWRVFRYDRAAGKAHPVPVRTHGGSVAFGNPKVTVLRAPSGRTAVVATMFVFSEGAAPGEAGPLLYYHELPA
jgi:hypothetical protein